jgi:glycosyltransferase involved in cell wall biosynthesis
VKKFCRRQPLVSVIIPARNSEATIEKCLQSIVGQTYRSIEIIIVDNHSSDGTIQIAKKYGAKVFSKGLERSTQINFGVKKAIGEYIYRIDSDFVLQPDVVREAVEMCEKHKCDAVAIHNTSDSTVSLWAKVRKVERDFVKNDDVNVAARFWKKDVFEILGGFDESLVVAEDYDLHNRLVGAGFRIGRIQAEETHIGEPRTLSEVVQKHYYYGKNIVRFIKKNPERALKQLGPLRESYFKGFSSSLDEPILAVGFVIYQLVRYAATAIGITSRAMGAQKVPAE